MPDNTGDGQSGSSSQNPDDQQNEQVIIEPLDVDKHNRESFSCGIEQIDNFFKKTARKLADAGNRGVRVMTNHQGDIVGFYATNMHAVHFGELPPKYKRTAPRDGHIPAAYFSIVGVDTRYQGQGYGGILLADALKRFVRAANLGIAIVILDVFDCGDAEQVARRKRLYEDFGFQSFPSQDLRMFMPIETARKLVTEE